MEQQAPRAADLSPEQIVRTYADMVYRLAFSRTRNKHDADDIFQEVFLRYLRKNPVFSSEEHRKAWLIRVTVNCSKKFWAAPWRKRMFPLEEAVAFENPEELFLHESLWKLPPKYRTVLHLFYYEDYTVEKISHLLKQKPATVRTQLTRARRLLKEIIKEDFDAERNLPESK